MPPGSPPYGPASPALPQSAAAARTIRPHVVRITIFATVDMPAATTVPCPSARHHGVCAGLPYLPQHGHAARAAAGQGPEHCAIRMTTVTLFAPMSNRADEVQASDPSAEDALMSSV